MKIILSALAIGAAVAGASAENLSSSRIDHKNWPRSLSGNTAITVIKTDRGVVSQVEYLGKSGSSYLMLFGHQTAIKGHWSIRSIHGIRQICFSYPKSAMLYGADLVFNNGGCETVKNYRARLSDLCRRNPWELGQKASPMQMTYLPVGATARCGVVYYAPIGTLPETLKEKVR